MAEEAKNFPSRVDANDECFLSPDNMTEEVKDYCRRTGQQVPETLGELATVIYTSLAECYAKTAKELEEMTGRTYSRICVVGGGSNAGYLNELTAKATGKEVHAGPGEATAIEISLRRCSNPASSNLFRKHVPASTNHLTSKFITHKREK